MDSKLLLAAADATAKLFYEKLPADCYRYSIEFQADSVHQAGADKAKASCNSALQITNSGLTQANPTNLGLVLKYSVLFDEIISEEQETIDLADKSFKETAEGLDELTEGNAPR
jgi:hypothetical protein